MRFFTLNDIVIVPSCPGPEHKEVGIEGEGKISRVKSEGKMEKFSISSNHSCSGTTSSPP